MKIIPPKLNNLNSNSAKAPFFGNSFFRILLIVLIVIIVLLILITLHNIVLSYLLDQKMHEYELYNSRKMVEKWNHYVNQQKLLMENQNKPPKNIKIDIKRIDSQRMEGEIVDSQRMNYFTDDNQKVNPDLLSNNENIKVDNENQQKILSYCQVPTLNTEQCYKSKEFECPIINGTYLQCTNNYIPKPKQYNADCSNRTFEMVPQPWKISENCYYNKIGFNREKKYNKVRFI
jgi:hypothetical protein